MVQYRNFRNADPPLILDAWNDSFTGRGAVRLRNATPFDRFILAKPYFDPAGLIMAVEGGKCLGFVHAGFVWNSQPKQGVIAMLMVRPDARRRGIGSELLRRGENYLKQNGAQQYFAGYSGTHCPFYLGVYGGADSPGILTSDALAGPWFQKRNYQIHHQVRVMQGDLGKPLKAPDPRFAYLRQRYNIKARTPKALADFGVECTLGQVEPLEFFLDDKSTGEVAARTYVWEMEGFSWRWSHPSLGLVNFEVNAPLRRQGLGKFLLLHLLRHFQEQYFEIAELQLEDSNLAGYQLLTNLGFQNVDVGQVLQRKP